MSDCRAPSESHAQTVRQASGVGRAAWYKGARLARPLVLTVLAALAFAVLLRFHHARFEDGMVRSFQRQQMEAARRLAVSIEEHVDSIRRSLVVLASHPDVCRLALDMNEILSSYLRKESAVLDDLVLLDSGGRELWRGSPRVRSEPGAHGDPTGRPAGPAGADQCVHVRMPVKLDGRHVGTLGASVNVYRVAIGSQAKASSACNTIFWLLDDTGTVIHGDAVSRPRHLSHVLRSGDAPKEAGHRLALLPYLVDRCVVGGESGLAEVVRRDDRVDELVAFVPVNLQGRRLGLVIGSERSAVSVPITSHERVTYALIMALALLYFATGYATYRSEHSHLELEEQRRRAAEQASKAKSDFLARMSHELRTPMNGVISMSELAMSTEDPGEQRKYLAVVRESANSLLSVVNDILDMSKIEAGRLELCQVPMNVPECVTNTMAPLAPLARGKGLSLRWEIDPQVPSIVKGDPGRLRQVLSNLVGNAIKYTLEGHVAVRVVPHTADQSHVTLRFEVSDTGPGMSREDIQRVFDAYYQCSDRQGHRRDGTGLGLTIARQFVELMGGQIRVRSDAGKGTVFSFTARFGLVTRQGRRVDKAALPSLGGVRTMVISGIPSNRERFCRLLDSWGALVGCSETPPEGLRLMKEAQGGAEPFRLILLDTSGADVDAFDFAAEVSNLTGYEKAAIAVICPAGLRGDALRCIQTGVDAYLGASVENDQLNLTLRMALQHAMSQKSESVITRHLSPDVPSLRILLVDDNPVNRQAASLILGQLGQTVRAVESGQDALKALETEEFDLALMDVEMPGMNGLETTVEIRRRERAGGRRMPIVAMTAHVPDSDCEDCLRAGMDRHIAKPFRPEHLKSLIAEVSSGLIADGPPRSHAGDAPMPSPEGPVWDRAEALRFSGGNEAAVEGIIRTFLTDLREKLPLADSAAATGHAGVLGALAHRWKGSLGLLGAGRAQSCAAQLEALCKAEEPERLLECFMRLREQLVSLEQVLSNAVKESKACVSS